MPILFHILYSSRYQQLQFPTNLSCVRLPMDYIETLKVAEKNPNSVVGIHEQDFLPRWCHNVKTFDSDGRKSVNSHCCYTDLNTSLLWNCRKMNLHTYSVSILHYFSYWRMDTVSREQTQIFCRNFIFLSNFHSLSFSVHISVRADLQKSRAVSAAGVKVIISPSFESYWKNSENKTFTLVLLREKYPKHLSSTQPSQASNH